MTCSHDLGKSNKLFGNWVEKSDYLNVIINTTDEERKQKKTNVPITLISIKMLLQCPSEPQVEGR